MEKITGSCVANALRADYMGKKSSFEENYIAQHERLGPMILNIVHKISLKVSPSVSFAAKFNVRPCLIFGETRYL